MWSVNSEKGYSQPTISMGEELVLMVAPQDAPMAIKIANSLNDPTNNSNSTNVVTKMARIRVQVNPYITGVGSGYYWFLIRAKKGLWLVTRRGAEISNYRDPSTKAMVVDLTCREAVHVRTVWGMFASGN
jgi:hypothetical protein